MSLMDFPMDALEALLVRVNRRAVELAGAGKPARTRDPGVHSIAGSVDRETQDFKPTVGSRAAGILRLLLGFKGEVGQTAKQLGVERTSRPATVLDERRLPRSSSYEPSLDRLITQGCRMMWVAAHPDDESFAGAVLARSSLHFGNPLHMLVLTSGEGGECLREEGCLPDLATVRRAEMAEVARLYQATLQIERFYNAPLPSESFPPRHEIAATWLDQGDPARVIARSIREFRPDVLLTLAPEFGGTGHPEHQLAARFAAAGVRLAATPAKGLGGRPFRVPHMYYLLNKYWFMKLIGQGFDPRPWTELFDARQPCCAGLSCLDVMAENTRPHRSQAADMEMVRRMSRIVHNLYLAATDPFEEVLDPLERVEKGGMG